MKHSIFKRLTAFTLVLMLMLSLCACSTSQTGGVDDSDVTVTTDGDKSTTITVIDQAGREITLEEPAESIVSCYYITTYAAMALGVEDRIVGLEKKAESRPIYHMAAPELIELPNVGSLKEFNVEAAAALEPDLVLMPVKLSEHAETLTDLGIQVLVVNPETQEDMEEMLTLIAKACGVEEKAEALLNYYDEHLASMEKLVADTDKPLVYMGSNSSYLETAPAAMYQSNLIELAGGENVAADIEGDYWTAVSYESILDMNPDVIIIPCGSAYSTADVLADPQLADVKAVKYGAVYQMPQEIEEWDSPIPSGILGVMWLTSVLHEDVYSFDTLKEDVTDYYQTFYGFEMDPALITK